MRWLFIILVACHSAPPPAVPVQTQVAEQPKPKPHTPDPDLHRPPKKKLLDIDWNAPHDPEALWRQIAPTGDDWEAKLAEIPGDLPITRQLAVTLLNQGNFTCSPAPPSTCNRAPLEVPAPAPNATLADPCLRRLLAMWALEQLEADDLPAIGDALRAMAAIPPPESQLVSIVLRILPDGDQDARYELLAIAWRAGQHELVDEVVSFFDHAHLIQAAMQLHVGAALHPLAAANDRAPFIAAVTDEQMAADAREDAMVELAGDAPKLAPDLHAALVVATKSKDCGVAAAAARVLDLHGDHAFVPKFRATRSVDAMMRAMCVLANYESLQRNDEPSYFPGYLPTSGLEQIKVSGDDTQRATVKPVDAILPDVEDLVNAMKHCKGTSCRSDDHEFRFTWKPGAGGLVLAKLEELELPPCVDPPAIPSP